jgi:hypothetical protein
MKIKFEYDKKIPDEVISVCFIEIVAQFKRLGINLRPIKMPVINAYLLDEDKYDKLFKEASESENVIDTSLKEWGEKVDMSSAFVTIGDADGYIIVISKNRNDIQNDLIHEMIHIFELEYNEPPGTFTKILGFAY